MRGPLNRGLLTVPMTSCYFPRGRPDFVLYIADSYSNIEITHLQYLASSLVVYFNVEITNPQYFASSFFLVSLSNASFLPRLTFLMPRLAFLTLSSACFVAVTIWCFLHRGFGNRGFRVT